MQARRLTTKRPISILLCANMLVGLASFSSASDPRPQLRRYDQGPLAHAEFRTNVRAALPGKALTMTRTMFTYRFEVIQTSAKTYEAKPTSLDAFSVFLPDESWWHRRAPRSLLDHEQGHFDIAEIAARRLRLAFRKALASDKPIRGLGDSMEAAQRSLEKKLQDVVDAANKQVEEENMQYDIRTQHGVRTSTQNEARRIQLLTLARLQQELRGKKSAKNEPKTSTSQKSN